jgi:hypothetical protein
MCSIDAGVSANITLHLPGDEVSKRGRQPAIGHVNHVHTGHHLEQLAAQMDHPSVAALA